MRDFWPFMNHSFEERAPLTECDIIPHFATELRSHLKTWCSKPPPTGALELEKIWRRRVFAKHSPNGLNSDSLKFGKWWCERQDNWTNQATSFLISYVRFLLRSIQSPTVCAASSVLTRDLHYPPASWSCGGVQHPLSLKKNLNGLPCIHHGGVSHQWWQAIEVT